MKKIAVINDLSGFGKCSLAVALPIISAHGVQCCALPTGIFSNQTGYDSYTSFDFTNYMPSFANEWKKLNPSFDGILTGFIANSKQGKIILDFINDFKKEKTLVVVDPVMGDDGEVYPCFDDELINAVVNLTQKAHIITPNITELCILCGEQYNSVVNLQKDDLIDEIFEMSKSLGKTVVTTGIQLSNKQIANAVYDNGKLQLVVSNKIGGSFSGTGDILSSFITAQCVNGVSVFDAVSKASNFIEKSLLDTVKTDNYKTVDGINFEKFLNTI
jgi:pyridoxine kinase